MRNIYPPLRPGMTALAAALALSSTPLLAQDAIVAPAEPAVPVIADPPPAPVAAEPVPAAPAAPSSALNIPRITVNMDDAPAAPRTAEAAPTPRINDARSTPVQPARTARAETPAPMPQPVPEADAPAQPIEATPVNPPTTAMTPPPAEVVTPSPQSTSVEPTKAGADEILPIAGGVLGVLALAGGAFAFAGRRRRYSKAVEAGTIVDEPLVLTERPIAARSPIVVPSPTTAAAGGLPVGFDLSRYGPHVQAAYRGPTADNPSLSLGRRLKRARFYDQRERMAAAGVARTPVETAPREAPASAFQPERATEYVTSRRLGGGYAGFRPAFQN